MTDPTSGAVGGEGSSGAMAKGLDYSKRAFDWFSGIVPAVEKLATACKVIGVMGMIAPVGVVLLLLADQWPPDFKVIIALVIIYGLLAWLPFSLFNFGGAVHTLSELPGMIRGTPDLYRQYSGEVVKLYSDIGDPATGKARGVGRGAFGGLKLVWRIRKEVPDVAGIASLARMSLFLLAFGGFVMTFVNLFLIPIMLVGTTIHA